MVALVITVIILIILASISISLALGDNGLISKARQGAQNYQEAEINETELLDKVLDNIGETNSTSTITPSVPTTYTAYTMGDSVTLGGEEFWVIEDSDENTSTVKLLAKLNVITTEGNENRYKQNANANTLRFDDDSNDYATSEIKLQVDAYKVAVEGRIGTGKTIQEARLMTGTSVDGEARAILDSSLTNKNDIVYGSTTKYRYWLGSVHYGRSDFGWFVEGFVPYIANGSVSTSNQYGLRPVLIVLKNNI